MTHVITDLLTVDEIKAIGNSLKNDTSSKFDTEFRTKWRNFVVLTLEHSKFDAEPKFGDFKILYVEHDPYQTTQQMREDMLNNRQLLITRAFNTPYSELMQPSTNLCFRTAHDIHHAMTDDCNFELWGEVCAFSIFAKYAQFLGGNYSNLFIKVLACEIVGQLCYLRTFGEFMPEQKVVVDAVPQHIIDRIIKAYR